MQDNGQALLGGQTTAGQMTAALRAQILGGGFGGVADVLAVTRGDKNSAMLLYCGCGLVYRDVGPRALTSRARATAVICGTDRPMQPGAQGSGTGALGSPHWFQGPSTPTRCTIRGGLRCTAGMPDIVYMYRVHAGPFAVYAHCYLSNYATKHIDFCQPRTLPLWRKV